MKPQVLVIEDDEALNDALCELLSDDYAPECVHTLAGGLDRLARATPACIVLDLNLPDGSGASLLARLTAEHRAVPAVLVSAAQAAPKVAGRFGIGLVPKPFDFDRLLDAISLAISRPIIPVDAAASDP